MTQNQKLEWLRKHEYEVDKFTESGQVTWEAWDTLDSGGYFVAMPTRNQAINEAYQFLSEQILGGYGELLQSIKFSAKTEDWQNFDWGMGKFRTLISALDK